MKNKCFKILICAVLMLLLASISALTVFAAGDVAGAIEQTWSTAKSQIQTVVNNVVFPVVDMILAILFFVKLGTAYFDQPLLHSPSTKQNMNSPHRQYFLPVLFSL